MEDSQTNGQEITVQPIENMVQIDDGKMFTTSLIIAQAFEKEHKDVLKAISNLECSKEFHERNFAPMVYEAEIGSGAKREFPAYRLTRDGFAFLAMGFTGKKAAAWKEKFLEAFNAMEKALLAQRDGEAVPIDQDEVPSLPEETRSSNFFRSRRKIGKGDLAALSGILHLEALIQEETWENAAERLCRRMNITWPSVREKQRGYKNVARYQRRKKLICQKSLNKTSLSQLEIGRFSDLSFLFRQLP